MGKAKLPLRLAIGLSMAIAVLNPIKTLVILKIEVMSVDEAFGSTSSLALTCTTSFFGPESDKLSVDTKASPHLHLSQTWCAVLSLLAWTLQSAIWVVSQVFDGGGIRAVAATEHCRRHGGRPARGGHQQAWSSEATPCSFTAQSNHSRVPSDEHGRLRCPCGASLLVWVICTAMLHS